MLAGAVGINRRETSDSASARLNRKYNNGKKEKRKKRKEPRHYYCKNTPEGDQHSRELRRRKKERNTPHLSHSYRGANGDDSVVNLLVNRLGRGEEEGGGGLPTTKLSRVISY